MSFENIQLPSTVLSNLFKQVVVTDDHASMPNGNRAQRTAEVIESPVQAAEQPVPQTTSQEAYQPEPAQPKPSSIPGFATKAQENLIVSTPIVSQPVQSEDSYSTQQNTRPQPASDAPGAPYRFLGKNAQHVSIVVFSPTEPFLPDDQLALLTKMLDACRLNLGDVAIINHATQPVHFSRLAEQLQPKRVILFGIQPELTGLPLSFPPFKEQEYAGCTYLLATSLADMNQPTEEGKLLKGKLWGCLKKMFNI
ncbi:hypothetical protein HHL16_19350 [Pseudoflavitalea sp. G-6-1-2]|uniref:hypothetical protein n=1 Tax=Pseudoflavitalea sp. G-6-1-2 TaxID=2728841 RepID=UPI001469E030|nr:hypothetical protein [Pseudoflavitalea sp. G-6-1-2]NML23043.1 hypothetical protein [Pseudoflavitalea sp. G-6-1-2]